MAAATTATTITPTTTTTSIDLDYYQNKIDNFINNLIYCDILDETFAGYVKNETESKLSTKQMLNDELIFTLQNVPTGSVDQMVKHYIEKTSTVVNYHQSEMLFSALKNAFQKQLVTAKTVCEHILYSDRFCFNNEVFWVNGLNFIHCILSTHTVDYKGVRDILVILLAKVISIPLKTTPLICNQITSLYNLMEYIFDRDSALLPAYFVLDEIQKKHQAWQNVHWKFSKLISSFVDSFRPVAQIASISRRPKILPIVGHSLSINSFKLDPNTVKYKMKGLLPWDQELDQPQYGLLMFILEQNCSIEVLANSVLCLSQVMGRSAILDKLLAELIIKTMGKCANMRTVESENFENYNLSEVNSEPSQCYLLWQHISTTVLYIEMVYKNIIFPDFASLAQEIYAFSTKHPNSKQILKKNREFFMWTLLQMAFKHMQDMPLDKVMPIIKLFDLFYPENEPLPVPDCSKQNCVYILSAASILVLMMNKSESDIAKLQRSVPVALKAHVEFLLKLIHDSSLQSVSHYSIVLLCNSYSTNADYSNKAFQLFLENIVGNRPTNSGQVGVVSNGQPPVSINVLDTLSMTTKISLANHIMNQFNSLVNLKAQHSLPSNLVETYSRLIAFCEREMFGIKAFTQLVNNVLRNHCWNHLYTLLELFLCRLNRVSHPTHIQLLWQIYKKETISQINHIQLYSYIENTALKIVLGLSSAQFLTLSALIHRSSVTHEPAQPVNFLPSDSEELNKVFILTLARVIHLTGYDSAGNTWVFDLLNGIKNNINISWSEFTLKCFPQVIKQYYLDNHTRPNEQKMEQLKQSVQEEFRKWKSMINEADIIKHFTAQGSPPLFYCVLYRLLLDNEDLKPVAYKVLDRIGARAQIVHLRSFVDYFCRLLAERTTVNSTEVERYFEILNEFIWKWHLVSLDRLLLCLILRTCHHTSPSVPFIIVQFLVIQNKSVQERVDVFVKEFSPEHWKQSNWAEKQKSYLQRYPEQYYFEHLQDSGGAGSQMTNNTILPRMFSTLPLRLLPMFDIIIHRFIEMHSNTVIQMAIQMLDNFGSIYKFHEHPITFLYNTLHYYEENLRQLPAFKKRLVSTIINAFKDIRPRNWAVSETFLNHCTSQRAEENWRPSPDYYRQLLGRMVDAMSNQGKCPFQPTDYRFNEFPNVLTHALYVTCVEILALGGEPEEVSNSVINVVLHHQKSILRSDIDLWINVTSQILSSLPESYSKVINNRIVQLLEDPSLLADKNLFTLFDFKNTHLFMTESTTGYLMALAYAYWSQGSVGQLCSLLPFLRERIKPIIQTEEQFVFVCHLVGPLLCRFSNERTRYVMDITIQLYEMLEIVDRNCSELKYSDIICDLFYHIKYMFTGNHIKNDVEKCIRNLSPKLSRKLRFISNISLTTDNEV